MKNYIKTWLREIVDEAESINKYHYNEYMEYFEKEGIFIDTIRKEIFLENPKNKAMKEDKAIKEALKQYCESMEKFLEDQYEIWRCEEEEKAKVKKYQPDSVPKELGGASKTKKLSLVLYELKNKDPMQFNLFCETFL